MALKKSEITKDYRKVALCYIRLSYTRDADDSNSPERQRANIQAICERNGWIPEWYEDVGGHKSGREEKNRPQWLALKSRLSDPDIIALVANDLSRLHRKGWRVGDLIDFLNRHGVNLVLAAPGREVDTTTTQGRMFLQFGAIIDEYYAEDISQRAKDNVAYRKAQGKSIGMPPFGTIRGEDGYLKPTVQGAWLLTNGKFVAGDSTSPPEEGAKWKGYYDAAHFILNLYALGRYGLEKIAYKFNDEGWAFRDRTGTPRRIDRDDVRRVIANWLEYGGIIVNRKAKDRPAYEKYNVEELPFNTDRAVFPIELLKKVALVRQTRTIKPTDQGVNRVTHFYPLAGITFCAHCERLAIQHNNPKLRSVFGGTDSYGTIRYRHKAGLKCGCVNRSVLCEVLEQDFGRLIKLLDIQPDALDLMTELAIQADKMRGAQNDDPETLEAEKREAIALCRRRIDAAVVLFGDGMIDREEYRRRIETNQREIAHWEARTTETEKIALELAMCIEAVEKIARLWDISSEENRQGLARSLFTSITYDLDTQRIVDFRLKAWAERFLILRAALYENDDIGGDNGSGGTPTDMARVEGERGETRAALGKIEAASVVETPMGHHFIHALFFGQGVFHFSILTLFFLI
jgi:DNA invertase Pin-like site-specific DNA recombinase